MSTAPNFERGDADADEQGDAGLARTGFGRVRSGGKKARPIPSDVIALQYEAGICGVAAESGKEFIPVLAARPDRSMLILLPVVIV